MYIVLNEFGDAWTGVGWGWKNTQRYLTVGAARRALQEAGEDVDDVSIIEDPFTVKQYVECA
jgi:hypothetical protein